MRTPNFVKRYSRPSGVCSSALTALVIALALSGCGPKAVDTTRVVQGDRACVALDSLLAGSLPERPWVLAGRATFDVEDYRVRGRYRMTVHSREEIAFEFEGTMLLGGHREDVVVWLSGDTLRVLDREGGALYEGAAVSDLIERGTGARGEWAGALRAVAGFAPRCSQRAEIRDDGEHASGLIDGGAFVLSTSEGRLVRASWPDPTASRTYSDRLDVRYDWNGPEARALTIGLPVRGWRIRLTVE